MGFLPVIGLSVVVKFIYDHQEVAAAARPYRDLIEAAARKYKVSAPLLVGILWQESRFNPAAVGKAGEIGMAQFMPIAAEDIGIAWESLRDNPEKQIDAAAALIALNRRRFDGSIFDAVRAYNVGSGAAAKNLTVGAGYAWEVCKVAFADAAYTILDRGVGPDA